MPLSADSPVGSGSNTVPAASPLDGIRAQLVRLKVPITVSGIDLAGRIFMVQTRTELVTPGGATFGCTHPLAPEQEISLKFGYAEVTGRVVGQTGVSDRGNQYGVAFMQDVDHFWGVAFPAVTGQAPALMLACCRCEQQRSFALNDIEFLVLKSNHRLSLYCSQCNESELWRIPEAPIAPRAKAEPLPLPPRKPLRLPGDKDSVMEEEVPAVDKNLIPLAEESRVPIAVPAPDRRAVPRNGAERRKSKRLKLPNAKACIERPGEDTEVVDVVNVSRGGASFFSNACYPIGAWIRISVPYTIGGSNIFQQARVVRMTMDGKGRNYGVEYVTVN